MIHPSPLFWSLKVMGSLRTGGAAPSLGMYSSCKVPLTVALRWSAEKAAGVNVSLDRMELPFLKYDSMGPFFSVGALGQICHSSLASRRFRASS